MSIPPVAPEEPTRSANRPFAPDRLPFFYGWVVLAAATVGIISSLPGQTIGIGVFTEYLMRDLGLSRTQVSAAYLGGTVFSASLLAAGGRLLDRWGARRTTVYTAILFGLILICASHSDGIATGLAQWLGLTGRWEVPFVVLLLAFSGIRFLGQGMLAMSSRTMIGQWFYYKRGLAIAVSSTITAFCFLSAPKLLFLLIEHFGWSGAWLILGLVLIGGTGSMAWVFFRDRPEQCGLVMDGRVLPPECTPKNPDLLIRKSFTRAEALRSLSFWIFNSGQSFQAFFLTAVLFHILSIGEDFGVGPDALLDLFLPASCIGLVVNLLVGWVSNKIRIKYVLTAQCLANVFIAGGMLALPYWTGKLGIILGLGLANGIFLTLLALVWPRFFGRQHLGAISGFSMAFLTLSSAFGPLVFSLSKAYTGHYKAILLVCIVIALGLALASFWADNPQRKLAS